MTRELKFRRYGLDGFDYFDLMRDNFITFERFYDTATAKNYDKIEQYTGLKDKNGKEIYEGDIVKRTHGDLVCPVRFEYGGFLPFTSDIITFDNDYCEVIGNIHENPELLGE